MDLSIIFGPVIANLKIFVLILGGVLLLGAIVRRPWLKGKFGEAVVNRYVSRNLDAARYHLFKNLTIPAQGGTTQIDHVIISKYGVFVIETKNMKGWIFGSEKQKQWTQKFPRKSWKFQNPLHQNYRHLRTLKALLNLQDNQIFSIVVFVGECELKTRMPDNVAKDGAFIGYIRSKTDVLLDSRELGKIETKIRKISLEKSFKTDREHIENLKSRKS